MIALLVGEPASASELKVLEMERMLIAMGLRYQSKLVARAVLGVCDEIGTVDGRKVHDLLAIAIPVLNERHSVDAIGFMQEQFRRELCASQA